MKAHRQPKQAKQKFSAKHFSLERYFLFHWQALLLSIQQLRQTPMVTWMTMAVIGIALALPTVFFVLLKNVHFMTEGLENGTQISLFLNPSITNTTATGELMAKINVLPEVASVRYISPEEGLKELENEEGVTGVLKQLPVNPLPPVFEVHPTATMSNPEKIQHLLDTLKALPGVESAKLDMLWIKRLQAMLTLGERSVFALSLLLGLAVILVIHHTIYLSTQARQKEMNILGLIGATLGFTRRPFLYTGMLYGVVGAIFACFLVEVFVFCLSFPADNLADLYHTHFSLKGLNFVEGVNILVLGLILGWVGSWSAVNQCIRGSTHKGMTFGRGK